LVVRLEQRLRRQSRDYLRSAAVMKHIRLWSGWSTMPLGDTTEFHNPYLHEVYVRELAVGEVGDGGDLTPGIRGI
jgi:hypothetical protein